MIGKEKRGNKNMDKDIILKKELKGFNINIDDIEPNDNILGALEEAIETTKIHSISANLTKEGLILSRPFRMPHHTASSIAIIGGGRNPKPRRNKLSSFRSIVFR